jgi:hypothetical protein
MAGVKGITDAVPEALSLHSKNLKYVSFRNCDLTDPAKMVLPILSFDPQKHF